MEKDIRKGNVLRDIGENYTLKPPRALSLCIDKRFNLSGRLSKFTFLCG